MTDHACIFLARSLPWERAHVDLLDQLAAIGRGETGEHWEDLPAAERANIEPIAPEAGEKLQRTGRSCGDLRSDDYRS